MVPRLATLQRPTGPLALEPSAPPSPNARGQQGREPLDLVDDRAEPADLLCPISLDLLTDPVVAADGHTYQRGALREYFATRRAGEWMIRGADVCAQANHVLSAVLWGVAAGLPLLSPMTGAELDNDAMFPNLVVRRQVGGSSSKLIALLCLSEYACPLKSSNGAGNTAPFQVVAFMDQQTLISGAQGLPTPPL
jgi:hypothetical protein